MPWVGASHSFAGWVPNVSGHLSFTMVDPRGSQSTYNHQADLGKPRVVALKRQRLAQDYPFWDYLVKTFRPAAAQEFIVLAQSCRVRTPYFVGSELKEADDEHGALCGVIIVVPVDDDATTKTHRTNLLGRLDNAIADAIADRAEGAADHGSGIALDLLDEIDRARPHVACYLLRFALFRTGELRIWFDIDEFVGRKTADETATPQEALTAERLPAQAYYFVKDLLHAHYHHDPHSDQILPLTRLSSAETDADFHADEVRWRYVTLRGLVRVVVELRQSKSLQGHKRALGIIAYAKAFQSVLAVTARERSASPTFVTHDDIIRYDFDNLAMSIGATDSAAESVNTSRLQLYAIMVGILLSALALWAGAVQIQPILCAALANQVACPKVGPGPVVSLINVIVANPLAFCSVLLGTGFLAFIALFRGTGAIPWAERFIKWLRGLSDAAGVQISRSTKGSDILGWLVSLALLGVIAAGALFVAYRIAPKTHVPELRVQERGRRVGPWGSLQPLVGRNLDRSGLLAKSVVAQDVRNLLAGDYQTFLRLLGQPALRREGDLLVAHSPATPGGDGAYLLLDPNGQRMEAGLRSDGAFRIHRSPGGTLTRPASVRMFLAGAQASDAEPVPMETSGCELSQGGLNGRTLQFRGNLRATRFCEFNIDLQKGQSLSFDSRHARGLDVQVVNRSGSHPMTPVYLAALPGRQVIRISWAGWDPKGAAALKPRPFFVRLDIH
ncbi:hypothetical protein U1763_02465 [Sphingomonas sp. LB2R24]